VKAKRSKQPAEDALRLAHERLRGFFDGKREVNEFCRRVGEPARYPSQQDEPADVAARKPGA